MRILLHPALSLRIWSIQAAFVLTPEPFEQTKRSLEAKCPCDQRSMDLFKKEAHFP